jgi:hypothetical protein
MTTKTTRIISIVLMAIPSAMIAMSGIMKLAGSEQIVQGFNKIGLGPYVKILGTVELLSLALFIYPKTYKIGFLLLCSYLGGAMSIELSGGQPPMAGIFLVVIWISVFLRNKQMFVETPKTGSN